MPGTAERIAEQAECFRLVYDTGPRYVNDHGFVADREGRLHLFHITGPAGKGCYDAGSEVSFGHAASADLTTWIAHPDVLAIDPASRHEPHHLFAPFVCAHGGRYHLFYAGINQDLRLESMCLATSADLFRWETHPYNPVFLPSRAWAEHNPGSGTWACCRDPHLLHHPTLGWILYYVTWLKETRYRLVALGAAVSDNLVSWQDVGPVMVREFAAEYSTTSMESPCVVAKAGRYYLFYKHRNETRVAVSDDPLRFTDKEDRWFAVAHAAEIFTWQGAWYISHCSRDPDDVAHTRSDRTRGLYLASLDWSRELPAVVPFVPPGRLGE